VDAVCVNFVFQETSMGIHYNSEGEMDLLDYLSNPEVLDVDDDGHVQLLSGAGLGIVMNEEKIRKHAVGGHNWKDREWELSDGTPTTW